MTLLSMALLLTACVAPSPKDFGGTWKPVNRFPSVPTAIPLKEEYEFFVSPLDGTLKNTLERWAKDSGLTVAYRLDDDYTLTTRAGQIHTLDINAAVELLNAIYASQHIFVTVKDKNIDVGITKTNKNIINGGQVESRAEQMKPKG